MTPLLLACRRGHGAVTEVLIARGANVRVKDKVSWTSISGLGVGASGLSDAPRSCRESSRFFINSGCMCFYCLRPAGSQYIMQV